MRVVLDTNVYIAVALGGEFAEDIFQLITTTSEITAITSEEIIQELQKKLQEKFNWSKEDIRRLITRIRRFTEIIAIREKLSVVTRDSEDNKILECAVSGNADLIVSIDQDLIKLKNYKGIGIIHPKTLSWTFPEYFKKNS